MWPQNRPHTPVSEPRGPTLMWALDSHWTSLALSFLLWKMRVKSRLQWLFLHRVNVLLWTGVSVDQRLRGKGLTSQSQENCASQRRLPGGGSVLQAPGRPTLVAFVVLPTLGNRCFEKSERRTY